MLFHSGGEQRNYFLVDYKTRDHNRAILFRHFFQERLVTSQTIQSKQLRQIRHQRSRSLHKLLIIINFNNKGSVNRYRFYQRSIGLSEKIVIEKDSRKNQHYANYRRGDDPSFVVVATHVIQVSGYRFQGYRLQ